MEPEAVTIQTRTAPCLRIYILFLRHTWKGWLQGFMSIAQ
jgi:hypothetical protein